MKQVNIYSIKFARKVSAILMGLLFWSSAIFAQNTCSAHFTFTADSITANTIHFTPVMTTSGTYYTWSFGDGSANSTSVTPTYTYAQPGKYVVCLSVYEPGGVCNDHWCDTIMVGTLPPACSAHFQFYAATNYPDSVHFYQYNTGSTYKFSWSFGDGTTSTDPMPWHVYRDSGNEVVCLTLTDSTSAGNCHDSWCDTIFVHGAPPPACNAKFVHYPSNTNADSIHFYPNVGTTGYTYAWNFGDGHTSTTPNPWHFYTDTGKFVACLTLSGSNVGGSCTWCDTVIITVAPPPVCNAHFHHYASSTNADSIYFYQYNTGSPYKFSWTFGDRQTSTNPSLWHLYTDTGKMVVCLTVTDTTAGGTCTDSWCDTTIYIHGIPKPVCNAHFQYYANTHNPDSLHFYASTTTSTSIKYYWNFGDGGTSTAQNQWHGFPGAGQYIVCLTVTDSMNTLNCTWCDTITIGNAIPCNAQFTSKVAVGALSVTFTSNPNPPGTKFTWTFGDNTSSSTPNPTHTYAQTGTYYVCLSVSDSGVCSNHFCDSVHVGNPSGGGCSAQFVHYTMTANIDSVHFYPTGNNPTGTTYSWSFPGGTPSTSSVFNPWVVYPPGIYVACLTVTYGTCTNNWCDTVKVVVVKPICNARFQFSASQTNPDSIHFYSAPPGASNIMKFTWNFGDGTGSHDPSPIHFFATPGVYYVCLDVSDSTPAGVCSDHWCDSIKAPGITPPHCNAHFYFYTSRSNPDSIHFYNNTTSTIIKYSWTFGDGTASHNADPWHFYPVPGTYQVCLTVTDSTIGGTCTDNWCDSVVILPPPPPVCDAHFKYYSLANPDSVHFYPVSNVAGTHYIWNFGDGTTSTAQYPWHFFATPGKYYVCLFVADTIPGNGSCTATWCDTVRILPVPPPVCNAHFYHVSANSTNSAVKFIPSANPPGTTDTWSFGDGTTSNDTNPIHIYAAPGTYYVCLTVKDSTSSGVCSDNWCDSIHVGLPLIPCNALFKHFQSYNYIYFTSAPNPPGTKFSWDFGDGTTATTANAYHPYANPGVYYVCLTVTDSALACSDKRCDSVRVGAFFPIICNSNFYCKPGNAMHSLYFFSAPNTTTTTYLWNFGDGDTSTLQNPFHQFAATGPYKVCLTVIDTVAGCSDTRCLTIGVMRMEMGGSTYDETGGAIIATVYPNPVTESATLHIENTQGNVTFRMFDNVGRIAKTITGLSNGDFAISKEGLGAGIYYYELFDSNNNMVRGKLVTE